MTPTSRVKVKSYARYGVVWKKTGDLVTIHSGLPVIVKARRDATSWAKAAGNARVVSLTVTYLIPPAKKGKRKP